MNPSKKILLFLFPLAPVLFFILDVALGSVSIPPADVLKILLTQSHPNQSWVHIVFDFRLPRALTALFAGAGLSISGLLMQTLFRNSLAGPFVLGISSGASLGVGLVILGSGGALLSLGIFSGIGTAGAAVAGSFLVMLLVLFVSGKVSGNMTILILGLMLGYLCGALVNFLMYFSGMESLQSYVLWTLGNFKSTGWAQISLLAAAVVLGGLGSLVLCKNLDALLLGENYAGSLGIPVKKSRMYIILLTSLLTGTVTAFCGPIAFLGLAVPHLCRGLLPSAGHLSLIPATGLLGGAIAILADLISGLPGSDASLPLNSVTAFIGAPVVIYVVLKSPHFKSSVRA